MSFILAIETTTKNCSVALFEDSVLVNIKEQNSDKYIHAEKLILFILEVVKGSNISLKDVDCIALSSGPGSFTGLRIGTSTAKGLCYSLDIPLVSVSTLKAMAFETSKNQNYKYYCPMIDARRMEVFASIYDSHNNEVREVRADVVDENTYASFLKEKMLFFGDGALKCRSIINNSNAHFIESKFPSAKNIGKLGFEKFKNKDFEDTAYYDPNYLKDFIVGKKKES